MDRKSFLPRPSKLLISQFLMWLFLFCPPWPLNLFNSFSLPRFTLALPLWSLEQAVSHSVPWVLLPVWGIYQTIGHIPVPWLICFDHYNSLVQVTERPFQGTWVLRCLFILSGSSLPLFSSTQCSPPIAGCSVDFRSTSGTEIWRPAEPSPPAVKIPWDATPQ